MTLGRRELLINSYLGLNLPLATGLLQTQETNLSRELVNLVESNYDRLPLDLRNMPETSYGKLWYQRRVVTQEMFKNRIEARRPGQSLGGLLPLNPVGTVEERILLETLSYTILTDIYTNNDGNISLECMTMKFPDRGKSLLAFVDWYFDSNLDGRFDEGLKDISIMYHPLAREDRKDKDEMDEAEARICQQRFKYALGKVIAAVKKYLKLAPQP